LCDYAYPRELLNIIMACEGPSSASETGSDNERPDGDDDLNNDGVTLWCLSSISGLGRLGTELEEGEADE